MGQCTEVSIVQIIIGKFLWQLLSVSAIVLANLCVSCIMTSQNEEVSTSSRQKQNIMAKDCSLQIFYVFFYDKQIIKMQLITAQIETPFLNISSLI